MSDDVTNLEPGTATASGELAEVTLAEHGRRTLFGGVPFEFEPRDIASMFAVGRSVDADPQFGERPGAAMMARAAMGLRRLGDVDLKGLSVDQRMHHVGKLRLADLMYLAAYRLASDDDGQVYRTVNEACPHCSKPIAGRLTLDIRALKAGASPGGDRSVTVRLRHPWRYLDQDVETVTLADPPLSRCAQPVTRQEWAAPAVRRLIDLTASITAVNGQAAIVTVDQMMQRSTDGRAMHAADAKLLLAQAAAVKTWVASTVGWQHPSCGETVQVPIEWEDGFF